MANLPSRSISRREFLRTGLVGGAAIIAADSLAFSPVRLQTVRFTVVIPDLPAGFQGYRIAQFSDVHFPNRCSAAMLMRTANRIRQERPDLVIFTGDLLHSKRRFQSDEFDAVMRRFDAPDGVFGCWGNHDYWFGFESAKKIVADHTPIKMLRNEHHILRRGSDQLALGGIDDLWEGDPDLDATFRGLDANVPRLLMAHNPDQAEVLTQERVDLQFSGHTHGGEVCLPKVVSFASKVSRFGQKYNRGFVQGPSYPVVVSKGVCLGHVGRVFADADITLTTLIRA